MNAEQLAAVAAPNGYLQIIAGPGTGKTYTLVQRILELLRRGIDPGRLVVVTFTRAAAREVLERVNRAAGSITRIIIGTFHSVALRLLRRHGGDMYRKISVIDEHDKMDILKRLDCVDGKHARKIAKEVSRVKSKDDLAGLDLGELGEVLEAYEKELKILHKLDFDGLLIEFRRFLNESSAVSMAVDAVLVDEFQDTSFLQLDIALLLAKECGNLTVVGDPDQSIYGFRNADPRNFVEMARRMPTTKCYLERNYRSEQPILSAATRVIEKSNDRYAGDRRLLSVRSSSKPAVQYVRFMSPGDEARMLAIHVKFLVDCGLSLDEMCVLSRYSSKFQPFEAALVAAGIPIKMVGGQRLTEQRDVRLIIDYLRVILDGNDALAVERTVNNPRRGFGVKTLQSARFANGLLSYQRVLSVGGEPTRKYEHIVETCRKLLGSMPEQSIEQAVEQAELVVDKLASMLLSPEMDVSAHIAAIKDSLNQFREMYEDLDEEDTRSLLEAFIDQWSLGTDGGKTDGDQQPHLTLSTIHSAKGLEWPVVYMLGASEEDSPNRPAHDADEDRRLLYVAMTRAKSALIISSGAAVTGFNKLLRVPSDAIRSELSTPDLNSLSECVGRELKLSATLKPHKRSVLGQSKRFGAKAPVELPPGFQLASELVQPAAPAPKKARSNAVTKGPKPGTLLSFWSK